MEINKISKYIKYQDQLNYLLTYKDDYIYLYYEKYYYLSGIIKINDTIYLYKMSNIKGYNPFKKRYLILNNLNLHYKTFMELFKYQKFNRDMKEISNLKFIFSYFKFIIYDFISWNFYYNIKYRIKNKK